MDLTEVQARECIMSRWSMSGNVRDPIPTSAVEKAVTKLLNNANIIMRDVDERGGFSFREYAQRHEKSRFWSMNDLADAITALVENQIIEFDLTDSRYHRRN